MTKEARKGYADQAKKKDIDFEYMRKERAATADRTYTLVESLFSKAQNGSGKRLIRCGEKATGKIPKIIPWSVYLNGEEYKDLSIDQKRELYHSQDNMKLWNTIRNKCKEAIWLDLEEFQSTKEEYIEKARKSAICTFAVVMDGKWYEHGKMGWWGCVSDEKNDWEDEFYSLLETIPEDTILTIVDCHI